MPTITDWLMVGITIVYVIATIAIFRANKKSAEVAETQLQETKEQLEESKTQFEQQMKETKRQYEETKRLSIMPYFQCDVSKNYSYEQNLAIETDNTSGTDYQDKVCFKNIGLGTAKDIRYIWKNLTSSYDRGAFLFYFALSNESQSISFTFNIPNYDRNEFSVFIELIFKDLINNSYSQTIEFKFKKDTFKNIYSIQHIAHEVIQDEENNNA